MKFTDNCPRIIRTNDKPAKVKLDYVRARTDTVTIAGNEYTYYIQKYPGGYALNFNGYIMNVIEGKLQNALDYTEGFIKEIVEGVSSLLLDKHEKYKNFVRDYGVSESLLQYLVESGNETDLRSYAIKTSCIRRAYI